MHPTKEVVYVLTGKLQAVFENIAAEIEEGDTLKTLLDISTAISTIPTIPQNC